MADRDQAMRQVEKPLSHDSQMISHQEEVVDGDKNGDGADRDWTDKEEKQLV